MITGMTKDSKVVSVHVLSQTIEVLLLLGQLLPELEQLFLFALADGVVLGGLFAALEGVTVERVHIN